MDRGTSPNPRVGGDTRGWTAEWHSANFSSFVSKNKRTHKEGFTDKKISIPKLEYRNSSLLFQEVIAGDERMSSSLECSSNRPPSCFHLFTFPSCFHNCYNRSYFGVKLGLRGKKRRKEEERGKNEESKAWGRKGSFAAFIEETRKKNRCK